MAGNNSVQILRGSKTYDPSNSHVTLLDGQPFYSKKTKELFVGDGETPIKDLSPVRGLAETTYDSTSKFAQSGKAVAEAIKPMTNEEIDNLWAETPGIGTTPGFSMTEGYVPVWNGATFTDGIKLEDVGKGGEVDQTYNPGSLNAQSGLAMSKALDDISSQLVNFGYDKYEANDQFMLKRNGYYMVYCNNPKIKIMKSGSEVTKVANAKQVVLMASPITKQPNSTSYHVAGNYWTGGGVSDALTGKMPIEGFRFTLDNSSYITCDEEFAVYQMTKGELANIRPIRILFIGNSHSEDTFMALSEVFFAEGRTNFTFGLCYEGGSSTTRHLENITNDYARYEYYESKSSNPGTYTMPFDSNKYDGKPERTTLKKVLGRYSWDYIFIQTHPLDFLHTDMYKTNRSNLVTKIRAIEGSSVKIGYSCSWMAPYSSDPSELTNLKEGTNNKEWYDAYVAALAGKEYNAANLYNIMKNAVQKNLLTDSNYSLVINCCSPMHYANQDYASKYFYRDVAHLAPLGRVLASYSFYTQFMKYLGKLTTLEEVKLEEYTLEGLTLSGTPKSIIKESVNTTLLNPWVKS